MPRAESKFENRLLRPTNILNPFIELPDYHFLSCLKTWIQLGPW